MTAQPSLVRRNHGQGHTYRLDGQWAPGATTVLGAGFPKPAIARWSSRTVAEAAVDEWDDLALLPISDRLERLRTAPDRDRDIAARRGTELHTYWERHAAGETVEIPDELEGHFRSYEKFVAEWRPRELLVEAVIAKRQPRYCGTLDTIADLADGKRWLLDWKTTRSGVFAENALQLAAYRNADFYVDDQGAELPLPAVDRCGVVWIRADGYDLHEVIAGPREWRTFQYVLEVAKFADEKFARDEYVEVVGPALTPPPQEVAA